MAGKLDYTRESLLNDPDLLVVYRDPVTPPKPAPGQPGTHSNFTPLEPEIFIAVLSDSHIVAFNGHVDLGTGIRTALAQIVAEELNVGFDSVTMVLGNSCEAPNQGPTIASATIQITAEPLRRAAAQAREYLLTLAAKHCEVEPALLSCQDGAIYLNDTVHSNDKHRLSVSYGALLQGARHALKLADHAPLKPTSDYTLVGHSTSRVDIPDKVTGKLTFVHDLRLPGMLHGRVIRPPYAGYDSGDFIGTSLVAVDESSVAHLPGVVSVVVIGDFVGVVAEREEQAAAAAKQLKVEWRPIKGLPQLDDIEKALLDLPSKQRVLLEEGDLDSALAAADQPLNRHYVWPFQLHGSIGPSCSVADAREGALHVWSGTQNPHSLRADLARLTGLDESVITITRMETSGCYGRNCADDVGADAALLSRAVGRPVRVQLTREQEHSWEPKGAAQYMAIQGGLNADGCPAGYRFSTRYPSNSAPTLALLLTGATPPIDIPFEMGDRTSVPPYRYPYRQIICDDVPTLVRASWLRGVSALPNTFAHESYIDELAYWAGEDPVAYRLRYLADDRAGELVEALVKRANWEPGSANANPRSDGDWRYGRGFAYAQYVHSKYPGFGAALAAWVIELRVNVKSGRIVIERLYVGQDAGLMVNPAGVRHQVHGNVIQMLSRTLKERVTFEDGLPTSKEWGGYPILRFSELPPIDVLLLDRPELPPLGVGESASLPGAPAIANALFDATGVRFTHPPFTPAAVREALHAALRLPMEAVS
ncbi:xanthine dehydrogenase family protein molybdopterin-binding subunit [Halomonas sp. ISL-60]|uniref:xanthine dehydrogenase family protein molybdopterin-binding subunit n=1 Tax=Halomonas sp. ISL-56 TaxID=2819149 RepID=UPI001BEAC633|nr:molybdopterin cofactor-binding domain-containing protein [Halomonas sp. ISL-56]MBT2772586.1 xanthine dehydrogenase family protein molybdopterin-binding subunit [Halomonas sp. ISL-60]MBT2801206.1 xanthine dehydrogenase family protein molybdopterin-binding subunit [Halomonas sp. ISL-56]